MKISKVALLIASFASMWFPVLAAKLITDNSLPDKGLKIPNENLWTKNLSTINHSPTRGGLGSYITSDYAERLLEAFYQHLRTFISTEKFDHSAFESQRVILSQQLSEISDLVSQEIYSARTSGQLSFIKHTFQDLTDSVETLVHYHVNTAPGHRWVYKIIDLNVRLVALHDSHGALDLSGKCIQPTLFKFWRFVNVWKEKFKMMDDVSEEFRMVYQSQSAKANRIICGLVVQLPESHLPKC